jgi:hypothetical protein
MEHSYQGRRTCAACQSCQLPVVRWPAAKSDRRILDTEDNSLHPLQDFGGRFGSQLIAEGIESAADHDTVRRLGVPLLQGYLISRPVPLDQARSIAGAPSLRISSMNAVAAAPPPHLS